MCVRDHLSQENTVSDTTRVMGHLSQQLDEYSDSKVEIHSVTCSTSREMDHRLFIEG